MIKLIDSDEYHERYFENLLTILFETEFKWTLERDSNRAEDGLALRHRYCQEADLDEEVLDQSLKIACTMLEMMVALANRCEESIAHNDEFGNRTAKWFWGMIRSMNLLDQDDGRYDEEYIYDVLECFALRNYAKNGCGGLFTLHKIDKDMRDLEIWYQMMWYLNELRREF